MLLIFRLRSITYHLNPPVQRDGIKMSPQMNTDERRWIYRCLSAFICGLYLILKREND